MKEFFGNVVKRFSSRKFLLVIAAAITSVLFPDYIEPIVLLTTLFVGTEGAADIVRAIGAFLVEKKQVEKDITLIQMGEIPAGSSQDKGGIVPGR